MGRRTLVSAVPMPASATATETPTTVTGTAVTTDSPKPHGRNPLILRIGGRIYVHPEKFKTGQLGEDAFFVNDPLHSDAEAAVSGRQSFGVADGVGDWVLRGVDSALYSRELMAQAQKVFKETEDVSPASAIQASFELVTEMGVQGSSTICLASFCAETGILSVANLVRGEMCPCSFYP